MSTDESETDTDYAAALNDHYGVPDLGAEILDTLEAADVDPEALTREDISGFEEFHIRGREATRELAELASIDAGATVLDVGSGVGGPARTLADEFDCEVVGVDLVDSYCRVARLFTERVGLADRVQFEQANALNLPYAADRFDVVWLQHTLMNVPETDRAIAEAARVLAPRGTLAIYEICAGTGGDPYFPVPWAGDDSLNFLDSTAGLRDTIVAQGFEPVAWNDVTAPSLEWFQGVVESMADRPDDAPPPLGLNLLMGAETPVKARNVVRSLEDDRIVVVQGVFDRAD